MVNVVRTFLFASLLLWLPLTSPAQEKPPLRWGVDDEGGLPFYFGAPGNTKEYIGFEVDLIKALSKELGREIEKEHAEFTELYNALNLGNVDFAMNGLEITPARTPAPDAGVPAL